MKMGTVCVQVCNGCHTEKGLYITHKSILMKHQTNKQTNKQTYSATINIGKNINYLYKYMYTSVITHCMLKKRRLTSMNVIHVTINASVDFLKINAHDNSVENNLPIIQSYCTRQVTI